MKYQFFTIPVISFDSEQEKLNHFCSQHSIVAVDKQLIMQGSHYVWAFCITYLQDSSSAVSSKSKQSQRIRIDYKEVLNEEDFTIFVELRNLRKQVAEQHGVPVYAIFTNEQLAAMVTGRVTTLAQLQTIEGVGESRLVKYGEVFVDGLLGLFNETPES